MSLKNPFGNAPAPDETNENAREKDDVANTLAQESRAGDPANIIEERVAKLEAEKEDLRKTLIHRQADFENFRKRVERERHEEARRATGVSIQHLLPVLDTFERALAAHDDPGVRGISQGRGIDLQTTLGNFSEAGTGTHRCAGKTF